MGSSTRRAASQAFYENVLESSSDEDSDGETDLLIAATGMGNEHFLMPPRKGGSSHKWHANIDRGREAGHLRLHKDHFDLINPLYKEKAFCRISKIGFSSYQKSFAAIRQLAYEVPGDLIDDYMCMSDSTCHEAMYRLCDIIVVFSKYYMRELNIEDTARLLSINESRGFLGCCAALTACNGSGRIVILVGRGSSKGIQSGAWSYWRLLPHMIYGFVTPLAWRIKQ
jgi:hypothetical protein